MSGGFHASARVTLVLDVEHGSSYGGGANIDQIYRQASEETKRAIESLFETKRDFQPVSVRIDKVFVRITAEEKR